MDDDELTFASAGVAGVHYQRCWACQFGQHSGGWHTWADQEDIDHAAKTKQVDPSASRCACPCSSGPELTPMPDEPDWESFTEQERSICGELGACGYDAEGRPMVHAETLEEDS